MRTAFHVFVSVPQAGTPEAAAAIAKTPTPLEDAKKTPKRFQREETEHPELLLGDPAEFGLRIIVRPSEHPEAVARRSQLEQSCNKHKEYVLKADTRDFYYLADESNSLWAASTYRCAVVSNLPDPRAGIQVRIIETDVFAEKCRCFVPQRRDNGKSAYFMGNRPDLSKIGTRCCPWDWQEGGDQPRFVLDRIYSGITTTAAASASSGDKKKKQPPVKAPAVSPPSSPSSATASDHGKTPNPEGGGYVSPLSNPATTRDVPEPRNTFMATAAVPPPGLGALKTRPAATFNALKNDDMALPAPSVGKASPADFNLNLDDEDLPALSPPPVRAPPAPAAKAPPIEPIESASKKREAPAESKKPRGKKAATEAAVATASTNGHSKDKTPIPVVSNVPAGAKTLGLIDMEVEVTGENFAAEVKKIKQSVVSQNSLAREVQARLEATIGVLVDQMGKVQQSNDKLDTKMDTFFTKLSALNTTIQLLLASQANGHAAVAAAPAPVVAPIDPAAEAKRVAKEAKRAAKEAEKKRDQEALAILQAKRKAEEEALAQRRAEEDALAKRLQAKTQDGDSDSNPSDDESSDDAKKKAKASAKKPAAKRAKKT